MIFYFLLMEPNKPVAFETNNFITDYECKRLIEYQESRCPNDLRAGFWAGRITDQYSTTIKPLIDDIHIKICYFIQQFYNEKVYLEYSNLVYWGKGMDLPVHADNFNIHDLSTINNTKFKYRDYGYILYLNGDFQGGELWFPKYDDYKIKPTAGKLVFFTGGSKDMHGVTKITDGKRYTLTGWFTKTKSRSRMVIEEEELEAVKKLQPHNCFGVRKL